MPSGRRDGAETDLEIIGLIAKEMGVPLPHAPAAPAVRAPAADVWSARDTLFTSGTLGRYSKILNAVPEKGARPMNFFVLSLIKAAVVAAALLTILAYLQWVERKVIAHMQLRLGPSAASARTGCCSRWRTSSS